MMPATGPKNLRLAGALADIVMIQVGLNPVAVKWAIDHIHAGAEAAGGTRTRCRRRCTPPCGSRTT